MVDRPVGEGSIKLISQPKRSCRVNSNEISPPTHAETTLEVFEIKDKSSVQGQMPPRVSSEFSGGEVRPAAKLISILFIILRNANRGIGKPSCAHA